MRRQINAGGQTLVLFALTLMLLTLMVCMTLSFGTKAKERMELQQLADQAAFSQAVATARTYNSLAVIHRAQIAHMVALAGVESAISFAGAYRSGLVMGLLYYLLELLNQSSLCFRWPPVVCACPGVWAAIQRIRAGFSEMRRISGFWQALDQAAGVQALANQAAAGTLYTAQGDAYLRALILDNLFNQKLPRKVMDQAAQGRPEFQTPTGPGGMTDVTIRETGWSPLPVGPGAGAVLPLNLFNSHSVQAAMGTRGNLFTNGRWLSQGVLTNALNRAFGATGETRLGIHMGSGYFSGQFHGNTISNASGAMAWADDHGIGTIRQRPGCRQISGWPMITFGFVRSTHMSDRSDQHIYLSWPTDSVPPPDRHTMGDCTRCPGMWPFFMDYNWLKLAMPDDNFGQPKNHAVIQRNLRARPAAADPWNLFFRFRFNPSAGETFDLRGGSGAPGSGIVMRDGTDISRATALSTGITYYHRAGHWKEPPNLFNPFWRAGLVRGDTDIDASGQRNDIPKSLRDANVPWAATAFDELYRVGYRGIP